MNRRGILKALFGSIAVVSGLEGFPLVRVLGDDQTLYVPNPFPERCSEAYHRLAFDGAKIFIRQNLEEIKRALRDPEHPLYWSPIVAFNFTWEDMKGLRHLAGLCPYEEVFWAAKRLEPLKSGPVV